MAAKFPGNPRLISEILQGDYRQLKETDSQMLELPEKVIHDLFEYLNNESTNSLKELQLRQNKGLPLLGVLIYTFLIILNGIKQPLLIGAVTIPPIHLPNFLVITIFFIILIFLPILIANGGIITNCLIEVFGNVAKQRKRGKK